MKSRQKILSVLFTFILAIFALFVFLVLNNNHSQNSRDLKAYVSNIDVNDLYLIHDKSNFNSARLDSGIDIVRKLEANEIRSIVNELDKLEIKDSFLLNYSYLSNNKKCFYTVGELTAKYFICFKEKRISNYIRIYNNKVVNWNIVGEDKIDLGRFMTHAPDLQSCIVNADCTLQTKGVCSEISEECKEDPESCGGGSKISINSKYDFIWNTPQYTNNKCIKPGESANADLGEYYLPVCENYTCNTLVIRP